MRVSKRIVAGVLAGCMVIGMNGCKKDAKSGNESVQATEEVEEVVTSDDLKLDTVIMAVGDAEVTYREVLFYIYQLKSRYDQGLTTDLWGYSLGEEETVESYAKEKIREEINQVKIICLQAQKEGHELTEEEKNEADKQAKEYFDKVSEADKNTYGLTQEMVNRIYEEHALANKMYDIVAGEVDTNISQEEAKQITVDYLLVMTNGTTRNNQQISMNEEEKKEALKRAKSLLKQAKKAEDFSAFADSNSDDDTVEVTIGKSDTANEFTQEAFALKKGEFSDVIEKGKGYYILYCVSDYDEEKTMEKKEELIKEREIKQFKEKYIQWSDNYKSVASSTLWNMINFKGE